MSDFIELPDGISLNRRNNDFYIELEYELIETIKCNKCPVAYESFLMSNASRHEGQIMIRPSNNNVWKNTLSKDRNKALKNLQYTLTLKFDNHKQRCNND